MLLGQKGVNINAGDIDGRTPLEIASRQGYDGTVKILLEHMGIDSNAKDIGGRIPYR